MVILASPKTLGHFAEGEVGGHEDGGLLVEIKRRADIVRIFPNDEAIVRLARALMLETNDEWTVAQSYMSLETLARVTNTPSLRLPVVAS